MRNITALVLFASTLTISAALLFILEPMVAKMLLPLAGGSPALWNTCMVFFQVTLLLGYMYAHLIVSRLGIGRQLIAHAVVLLLPLFVLPTTVSALVVPRAEDEPNLWLFRTLILSVGLPFFAVSTTSPLLSRWFAGLKVEQSSDPYFLFAASNFGSLAGLLSYPLLIEPHWGLSEQTKTWQVFYVVLLLFTLMCGLMRFRAERGAPEEELSKTEEEEEAPITSLRRWNWILLTALPASLVLGVTTFVTKDMASIPMFWVIPLALYLASIMLAFSRLPAWLYRVLDSSMPVLLIMTFILISASTIGRGVHNVLLGLPLQLLTLFVVSLSLHGKVAADRPNPRQLTQYYLFFSTGGVLGSSVTALVAPVIFDSPVEYPLLLGAIAALAVGGPFRKKSFRIEKFIPAWVLPLFTAALAYALFADPARDYILGKQPDLVLKLLDQSWRVIVPLAVVLFAARTRTDLRVSLTCLFLIAAIVGSHDASVVGRKRNFFGVLTARVNNSHNCIELYHDATLHGEQSLDPELRFEPGLYYLRAGTIGTVCTKLFGDVDQPGKEAEPDSSRQPYAMIGLGSGACLAYAHRDQAVDLFEINPDVVRLSTDPLYFTYLYSAYKRGVKLNFSLGDARVKMKEAPDRRYQLIILDAFNSDNPPFHLLTREALQLYRQKLAPGGVIAYHCSSRYYDIVSIVWNLVTDARLHGLACYGDFFDTSWVLVSEDKSTLQKLKSGDTWMWAPVKTRPDERVWTDDFSNPFAFIQTEKPRVGTVEIIQNPDGTYGTRLIRK